MKKIIFLLLLSNFCVAQNVENIKKSDTIYVLFNKKSNQHVFNGFLVEKKIKTKLFLIISNSTNSYNFTFEENSGKENKIILRRNKINKFLIEKKEKIIDELFLSKLNTEIPSEDIFVKNNELKIIYIMDESRKGKFYLYKIKSMYHNYPED